MKKILKFALVLAMAAATVPTTMSAMYHFNPDTPRNPEEQTALDSYIEKIKKHSGDKATINIKDELTGNTPLHQVLTTELIETADGQWAFVDEATKLKIVKFLTSRGAKPNIKNKNGIAPLQIAAKNCLNEIVNFLLTVGADQNTQDDLIGGTPLHKAAGMGFVGIVRDLLEHGAQPNIQDLFGWTPLHKAACEGKAGAVAILLKHTANPTIKNNAHQTPYDMALTHKQQEVVDILAAAMKQWEPTDNSLK